MFAGIRRSTVHRVSIRLIALDIDGTLIPPGGGHVALPDAAITSAIADLNRAGVVVVLASGRMYPGTARIARHLGLTTPLICQQGASIHAPDGAINHRFAIKPFFSGSGIGGLSAR